MATDILAEQVINGFNPVTRMDIINNSDVVMEYIRQMQCLFTSIALIGHHSGTSSEMAHIVGLADIGAGIAQFAENDEDVIRERAEKAGVIKSAGVPSHE